jgi:hypothetical protein
MRYPTRAFQSDTTVVSNDRRHPHHVSQTKAAPANPSGRLSPTLLTKPPTYQVLNLRGGFSFGMAENGGSTIFSRKSLRSTRYRGLGWGYPPVHGLVGVVRNSWRNNGFLMGDECFHRKLALVELQNRCHCPDSTRCHQLAQKFSESCPACVRAVADVSRSPGIAVKEPVPRCGAERFAA